jgi:predicted peptidase
MKLLPTLFVLTIGSGLLCAQPQRPVVHQLPSVVAEEVISMNTKCLIFPPAEKSKKKVPLLLYLHGAGGGRAPLERLGMQANALLAGIKKFGKGPCYVVVPQCFQKTKSGDKSTWEPSDLNLLLDELLEKFPIDPQRVYLTGNSMGGYGSWAWGGHSPERFAAIAPVVGGIGPGGPKDVTPDLNKWARNLAKVPVYAFAGGKDKVVPAERSERMDNEIRKAGGKLAKIKVYPEGGHNVRQQVYNSEEFYDWMFSQSRKTVGETK